jgi:hypothetical protein
MSSSEEAVMTIQVAVLKVLLIGLLACTSSSTNADPLATYQAAGEHVVLMTERCGAKGARMQRASKRSEAETQDGCWAVNARGNPVVLWSDGQVQEIDQSQVKLAPEYERMLQDLEPAAVANRKEAPPHNRQRPAWCDKAGFPHEKLVCRDRDLSAADLALAPLWRAYRNERRLNQVQQGRVKSDYFRRLKACGARKACISREQASQRRFYEAELARR